MSQNSNADKSASNENPNDNKGQEGKGPKYYVDIEGVLIPWDKETITTEEIISLGGWEPNQAVVLIDKDNQEHNLVPGQVIELKPGMGFSKKIRFKRG